MKTMERLTTQHQVRLAEAQPCAVQISTGWIIDDAVVPFKSGLHREVASRFLRPVVELDIYEFGRPTLAHRPGHLCCAFALYGSSTGVSVLQMEHQQLLFALPVRSE